MEFKNPKLIIDTSRTPEGAFTWRSPSNIALVKYWGKYGVQLPRNPSVSFTLENAYTETTLEYRPKRGVDKGIALDFYFEGEPNEAFKAKVLGFLESITEYFPFLKQMEFTIRSKNSFPHSAGIASSASSMSALALCLCSLEDKLFGTLKDDTDFHLKASYIARLGSGSACRSVYKKAAIWGETGENELASNLYAIDYSEFLHEKFQNYRDAILMVSKTEKSVSSRAGHGLMENNIYAESRYQQARNNMNHILSALETGDVERFGQIVEQEAMTLHALMMTSNPPFILMEPNSLILINKVRDWRKETGHPLYFTLDAGPNLHLLYPDSIAEVVENFIKSDLVQYCQNGEWLADKMGDGPVQL